MTSTFSKFVASVAVVLTLAASPVFAYQTTTSGTTIGAAVLVWKFVIEKDEKKDETKKVAQAYLQENSVQLARDLNLGAGPAVNDLAVAFKVTPGHEAEFRNVLRANRGELASLARDGQNDPERAYEFFRTLTSKVSENKVLASDIEAARNS